MSSFLGYSSLNPSPYRLSFQMSYLEEFPVPKVGSYHFVICSPSTVNNTFKDYDHASVWCDY